MVYREVEESLDLVCMKVACHHAVTSCSCKHVCNQLRADGYSRLVLAILSCPTEIRHYGNHFVSGSSLCCIDHEQKLEKIVCRRKCRLDDEDSRASDAFVIAWLEFSVAECQDIRLSQFKSELYSYLFSKVLRSFACKYLDFVFVVHFMRVLVFFFNCIEYRLYISEDLISAESGLR